MGPTAGGCCCSCAAAEVESARRPSASTTGAHGCGRAAARGPATALRACQTDATVAVRSARSAEVRSAALPLAFLLRPDPSIDMLLHTAGCCSIACGQRTRTQRRGGPAPGGHRRAGPPSTPAAARPAKLPAPAASRACACRLRRWRPLRARSSSCHVTRRELEWRTMARLRVTCTSAPCNLAAQRLLPVLLGALEHISRNASGLAARKQEQQRCPAGVDQLLPRRTTVCSSAASDRASSSLAHSRTCARRGGLREPSAVLHALASLSLGHAATSRSPRSTFGGARSNWSNKVVHLSPRSRRVHPSCSAERRRLPARALQPPGHLGERAQAEVHQVQERPPVRELRRQQVAAQPCDARKRPQGQKSLHAPWSADATAPTPPTHSAPAAARMDAARSASAPPTPSAAASCCDILLRAVAAAASAGTLHTTTRTARRPQLPRHRAPRPPTRPLTHLV